jgi:hypothetical protein
MLLPESLTLINTLIMSGERRIQTRHENVVKVIAKFIRKEVYISSPVLGFELRVFTLSHCTSPIIVKGFLR